MTKELSDKIRIGTFVCTVLVVWRHAMNLRAFDLTSDNGSLAFFIEHGISKQTEIAVPFFFLVSGFFFFRYTYYGKNEYFRMISKKWHTLFVPFLFWNVVGIVPLLTTHKFVYEEEWWRYGVQLLHSDWSGILWYVRDIMTMMLLVPLYGWIFAVNSKWLYAAVGLYLFYNWLPVDCGWVSREGMLFFFLGGVLQKYSSVLTLKMPKYLLVVMLVAWMISCFGFPFYWPIHRYNTLLGVLIGWQLLDYFPQKWRSPLLKVCPLSFFVYVVHANILGIMKVSLARSFSFNEAVALSAFFVLPFVTVFIALGVGAVWKKYSSKTFGIVTGGRA
ncbi:acyltransferase family protein [Prevotella sp. PCHR]|uniref:Acyltransferase family protein n=1 Tax=Xylanibacter caecicola TaxID=2736294 RepID=A0ABX2B4A3_9BACT|nr:acyltransferase family protein [Xylanibacter caecicola]NPE25065.1 acyltransferase family protein [Xylanibacter caecicola]